MATPTYDLIEEQVLGSATTTVTFSPIPGTYKDLVLEITHTADSTNTVGLRFNSDTGNNYSETYMLGNGSAASSGRDTSQNAAYVGNSYTSINTMQVSIMSYANTNVYKTLLSRSGTASVSTAAWVALWRSTAAITSITCAMNSNSQTGSTFRLWGIA